MRFALKPNLMLMNSYFHVSEQQVRESLWVTLQHKAIHVSNV